ncbi:MAG: adhesin, partial [Rhodocyclales bacterium GT-UBC]
MTQAQLSNLGSDPVGIGTGKGTLILTGYDATSGKVSYTYDPDVQSHNGNVLDVIDLTVTDSLGHSGTGSLDIQITDSKPVAIDDDASITEGTATNTVSGNVLLGVGADNVGADTNATPVGAANTALNYGTLVLNANGSYTYTLDNANPTVKALKNGEHLTEEYTYTLTDGDGSSTTAKLTITINGQDDALPTLDIPDENVPGQADGDKTVAETADAVGGEFTISAAGGLASLTVGTTVITSSQLNNLGTTPVSIDTGKGTLVLTGYDATSGKVSYTYDPQVQSHDGSVLDAISLKVTDNQGQSTTGSLDIEITDSKPLAVDDVATITEGDVPNTVSGNVLLGVGADNVGADTNATPVGAANTALNYGTLVLNANGSYTYTLDNANPTVKALKNGEHLTEEYTYTLTDGDGSSTTAKLTITINGQDDALPTLDIPDENVPGQADGDKTVAETADAVGGEFTISAAGGLASLTVGTTVITSSQLNNLGTTPVSIDTGKGTLVLTGYDATSGKVSYTYDPQVQSHDGSVLDAISLKVTDNQGQSTTGSLDIEITDSKPLAVDDVATITEDATPNTVSGNVLTGAGADTV